MLVMSPGSQALTVRASQLTSDELRDNMQEVVEMLLEDGEPQLEAEFIGTETVKVA